MCHTLYPSLYVTLSDTMLPLVELEGSEGVVLPRPFTIEDGKIVGAKLSLWLGLSCCSGGELVQDL